MKNKIVNLILVISSIAFGGCVLVFKQATAEEQEKTQAKSSTKGCSGIMDRDYMKWQAQIKRENKVFADLRTKDRESTVKENRDERCSALRKICETHNLRICERVCENSH